MSGIYKHSHFSPDQFGHGGNKRTAQISQLLMDANLDVNNVEFSYSISDNKLVSIIKGINYSKNLNTSLKNKYAIGRYLKMFDEYIKYNRPSLFIWESTVDYYLLLPEILYKYNVPFVALPHNIESLVKDAKSVFSNQKSPNWLLEEVKYFKYCNQAFAISKEDEWLLSLHNIKTNYLPYYPTESLKNHLLAIRYTKQKHKKISNSPTHVLMLGTFFNHPTFSGYLKVIEQIKHDRDIQIHVAGYGSEQLNNIFNEDNIKIWGAVNDDELCQLIIKCDYAVIHQELSSGSLTRIPELLIAGLPLLVNNHASRSCRNFDGVVVYNTFAELLDLIHSGSKQMPAVLERPGQEKLFIDFIINMIRN